MIKNLTNYVAIPLAISAFVIIALSMNRPVEMPELPIRNTPIPSIQSDSDAKVEDDLAFVHTVQPLFDNQIDSLDFNFSPFLGNCYVGFKEAVAFKESRGNYFAVNTFGYLGKYQFGRGTLKLIGIDNIDLFLNNPELQEKAFLANAARNKWILRKDINRFVGKKIKGVTVTESGILAAAHLAGPGSVKKFLRSYGRDDFSDAFGTTVRTYLKKFSGYDTSSIIPDRYAKAML